MRLLAKAWFGLTYNERWAILVVLGIFLLGLGARAWHLSRNHASVHPTSATFSPAIQSKE